jgi:hypothetical protein
MDSYTIDFYKYIFMRSDGGNTVKCISSVSRKPHMWHSGHGHISCVRFYVCDPCKRILGYLVCGVPKINPPPPSSFRL